MEQQASAKKHMVNYGLILGVISLIMGVYFYISETYFKPHWAFGVFGFIVMIVIITLAIKAFRADNGGFLTLGQALKVGIGVALVSALIGVGWNLLLTNVLVEDYPDKMMAFQREMMIESQPDMSDEQLDTAMGFMEKFSNPIFTNAVQVLMGIFFGFIISLISGLVLKRENPNA